MAWEVGHREGASKPQWNPGTWGLQLSSLELLLCWSLVIVVVANYVQHVNIRY